MSSKDGRGSNCEEAKRQTAEKLYWRHFQKGGKILNLDAISVVGVVWRVLDVFNINIESIHYSQNNLYANYFFQQYF